MSKDPLVIALKKLSYRAYSQKEMEEYLAKAGYNREQRQEILHQLIQWHYLDDQKLASSLCEYYIQHKPMGYSLIYNKLRQKGIPHDYIVTALADYDKTKELEVAGRLAEKYLLREVECEQTSKVKAALARHLQRKGFSTAIIFEILTDNFPE